MIHKLQKPFVNVVTFPNSEEESRDETRGDDVADDMDTELQDILVDEDDQSGHFKIDVLHGLGGDDVVDGLTDKIDGVVAFVTGGGGAVRGYRTTYTSV